MLSLKKLIWIDAIAAFVAGTIVFMIRSWLSSLIDLPENLLLILSIISLCYGSYSFTLALDELYKNSLALEQEFTVLVERGDH